MIFEPRVTPRACKAMISYGRRELALANNIAHWRKTWQQAYNAQAFRDQQRTTLGLPLDDRIAQLEQSKHELRGFKALRDLNLKMLLRESQGTLV